VNNTATASPNVSAGHGAIAEAGGTINLHAGTSITTAAFNSVGLGASGAGSRVVADALIPVTMNGRGAMGVYLHDGGQVSLLPGSTLQMMDEQHRRYRRQHHCPAWNDRPWIDDQSRRRWCFGQAGSTGVVAVNGGTSPLRT